MITYTAKQFKLRYGHKPGQIFNLERHLTAQHKLDAMSGPTRAVLRLEFGTLHAEPEINYALEVRWWLGDDGNLKGVIDHVSIFKDYLEMDQYRKKTAAKAIKLNQN